LNSPPKLATDAPAAEQLRRYAAEFAEMAMQLELGGPR
jgi:hypothetical protein